MTIRIVCLATLLNCCFLFSFGQQNNLKGFHLKGHIDGIENGTKVYLHDIDAQVKIDSAISSSGDFILKGFVERPTTCWILCKDEYAIIMVENTEMKFQSPINNMRLNAIIKGGKEQDLQNELFIKQNPFDKIFFSTYDSLNKKLFSNSDDKKRMLKIFNEAQTTSQDLYVEFGKRHPNSYFGLDIIYRNRQRIGKDTIETLFSQLREEFKSTNKAEALKVFLYGELAEKGKKFIDFDAETLNGIPFKLSSLKGNYILLSFWSASCGPCRRENKKISQDYNRFKNKISIVSFSTDINKSIWQKASKSDNILWTNVSDLKGDNGKIKTQYNVQAIPTSFLINKDGVIIEKFIGLDEDFLNQLEKLMVDK